MEKKNVFKFYQGVFYHVLPFVNTSLSFFR